MPRRLLNVALVLLAALLVANAAAIAAPATPVPAAFTVNHMMVANSLDNNMAPNDATMTGTINLDANTANNAVAANMMATAEKSATRHNFGAPRKLPTNMAANIANIAANVHKAQAAG